MQMSRHVDFGLKGTECNGCLVDSGIKLLLIYLKTLCYALCKSWGENNAKNSVMAP